MAQMKFRVIMAVGVASCAVFGCGDERASQSTDAKPLETVAAVADVNFEPSDESYQSSGAKPGSPYTISYRITGTPVVGSPVTVDLRVESQHVSQPFSLDYRINDSTSMVLADAQPARVSLAFADNESTIAQRVSIIPQREGRFYLNVSASFETDNGTMSTVTAIPIQVGTGTRELQSHGELQQSEDGETVRVLKVQ